MNAATASEIARLETMTITKVVERFESLFGEKCRSRNKRYLIRRIAWRLQANAEGDLSERARARAAELALDSEVRVTPPREAIQPRLVTADVQSRPALDQRLPPPGSMLHREYKGRQIRVLIVNNGFEYEGQLFKSLTAVANAITGSHVNVSAGVTTTLVKLTSDDLSKSTTDPKWDTDNRSCKMRIEWLW